MFLKAHAKQTPSSTRRVLSVLFVWMAIVAVGNGKTQQSKHTPDIQVHERISILMRDTIRRGEHMVDGVKIWKSARPSNEELEEVQSYGDGAVPVLADYLKSEDVRERELALRFLGNLGGSRIVEPLRIVLLNDTSAGIRELALRWLATVPWDLVSPIIENSAKSDSDTKVRESAKEIMASHTRKSG